MRIADIVIDTNDAKAGKLLRRGKDDPQYVDEEGFIHAPTEPGLSEGIDAQWIEERRAERLT